MVNLHMKTKKEKKKKSAATDQISQYPPSAGRRELAQLLDAPFLGYILSKFCCCSGLMGGASLTVPVAGAVALSSPHPLKKIGPPIAKANT
jgi:hypothetical protein